MTTKAPRRGRKRRRSGFGKSPSSSKAPETFLANEPLETFSTERDWIDDVWLSPGSSMRDVAFRRGSRSEVPGMPMPRKGRPWTMSEQEMRSLLTTMKTMGHEALAHELFFDCFPELDSVLKMGGLKTTSLFRMALLYFLFVPDARERLLIRLRGLPKRGG